MPRRMTCAVCGQQMWRGSGSLPEGQATCHSCRRTRNPRRSSRKPATCVRCGEAKPGPRFTYCLDCSAIVRRESGRGRSKAKTSTRGYGRAHQLEREKWRRFIDTGLVECHAITCLEPSRLILPGTSWDLGHNEDRTMWTGPEHAGCNRSEGAKRGNRQRKSNAVRRWAV